MPLLDVSWVTQDPMLADIFSVTRWANMVGTNGRLQPTITETLQGLMGVVTQQAPSALMNKDDMTIIPRRIFVASIFNFRGPTLDPVTGLQYQPDHIQWNGSDYKVVDVLPYSRYGRGVTEVIAESQTAVGNQQ